MFTGMDGNAAGCYLQFQLSRRAHIIRQESTADRIESNSLSRREHKPEEEPDFSFPNLPYDVLIQS
jgi:hypothetical protein